MKKFYSILLAIGVIILLIPSEVSAQTYTYDQSKSSLNVGNPGTLRGTAYDYTTTGGTIIHRGNSGPNGSTGSYNSTNYWSVARAIPFPFKFYGATVDSFCVSKNGLLTFSTNVAGTAVNTALNSNSALPNTNLPDSTIAYFWESMGTNISSRDYIYSIPYGSTGNRQLWILNYSWKLGNSSYAYFAVVLDEKTNDIYVVDMNYFYSSSALTMTVGTQLSSTSAVQVNSGLNSSAGSPNIIFGSGGSVHSNNEYYIFEEKLLVTDDMSVVEMDNPSGAICSTSDSIKVKVKNEGTNAVTDFDVEWSVNGTSQSTYSYSGSLASGASTTVNLGSYTYGTSTSTFNFQFRTDDPNGNTDKNLANDTVKKTLKKGLSGSYTVGTSSSNYATMAAAMADLKASGVCGPVTMNIAKGTYTGQVALEGDISGASSANTITFKSATGKQADVIFAYSSTGTSKLTTFLLKNTSYIIMRDVTFEAKGTSYGWPTQVWSASNISFINCHFKCKYIGTSSYNNNLVINGSATSYSTGSLNHDITVDSCTFTNGGYAACSSYGSGTASFSNGLTFTNNTLINSGYYGLRIYYQGAPQISNNHITMRSGAWCGIYMYYVKSTSTVPVRINRNQVYKSSYYGIYMSSCDNSSSQQGELYNNIIGNFSGAPTYYGIYNFSSDYWRVYHNTVDVRASSSSTIRACYYTSVSYSDIRNNIFSIQSSASSSSHYALYNTSSPSTNRKCDHNVYYNPNGTYLIYSGGSRTASVLNSYSTAGDGNSINKMPPFKSASDAHLSDGCFDKVDALMGVSEDIDGDSRDPVFPHPGADEVVLSSNDVGVVSIESPSGTVSSGTQTVRVIVRNYGSNSVSGYNVSYKVAGGSSVTQAVSGTLASCSNDTITFTTTFSHTVGCTNLNAWTSAPNTTTDGNVSNDTATSSFGVAMSGTFTVGGTSGDFSTFGEAVDALNCAGISGAVVFNVVSGTYTEQVNLGSYTGSSSTNTITFQSASSNTTKPVLRFATTSATNNGVLNFSGSSNIIFKGIHVKQTATTSTSMNYCAVVTMAGSNSSLTIEDCKLEGITPTYTYYNYSSIIYDGTGTGNMSNDIIIKNNELIKGSYSIYTFGGNTGTLQRGWVITGNTISGFVNYSLYCYYLTGLEISNNTITSSLSTGIYARYCDGAMKITNNRITGVTSGYGIYMYYCDATSGSPALVANNTIQVGNGYSYVRGMYVQYCKYQKILHNTVVNNTTYASTTYGAGYFYFTSSYPGNELKNNIFVANNGGYSVYLYYSGTNHYFAALDYNIYYSTATGSHIYAGGNYSSVAAYKSAKSGKDPNSFEEKPPFKSSSDLHLADGCFTKVPSVSDVTTDMDGATRNTTSTHPGADEVETGALDAGVTEILSPKGIVSSGSQTVEVVVKNFGTTTISTLTVSYTVGTTTNSQTFGVSLAGCTADTLTFTTGYNHTGGCASISAKTSDPNALTDAVPSNDEGPSQSFGVSVSGTFTVGGTSGDFSSLSDAIENLLCAGISGPVTLNVVSGTYNERVSLLPISGMSSTNTVTIQSHPSNTSMPIVQSDNGGLTNNVILFNGSSYFTIDGIHFKANNATYNRVVEMQGSNSNITIKNCKLESQTVFTTSSNSYIIYDRTGSANMSNNIKIMNNTLTGGSYAIYNYGGGTSSTDLQDGWVISGNTVTGFAYMGVYNLYNKNLILTNNTITTKSTYSTNLYGTYFRYCDGAMVISGNHVDIDRGGYGMYMYYCDATSTSPAVISNNYLRIGNGTSWSRGVFAYYGSYQNWYNNTFRSFSSSSYSSSNSYATMRLYYTSNTSIFRNNIVSNYGGGYALYFYNPTYVKSDYNNIHSTSTGSHIYAAGTYSSLSAYQTAKGTDLNSFDKDPKFSSSPVYQPNQEEFFNAGDSTGLTVDIDSNSRPAAMSTIGALEINPDLNIISVAGDSACGTMNSASTVTVTFKNEGDIIQQMASFNVSLDTFAAVPVTITGPFAKGMTYTRTLPVTLDLSGTSANVITVSHTGGDVDASDNSASTSVPYWAYPVSSFTQADSCLGDAMSFTNTSTVATGSIASTDWMFGDGGTAATTNPTHTYASNGTYTVTIMSESNVGCRDTVTQSINVLTALAAGTISSASTICYNAAPSMLTSTAAASGSAGAYQYQWQSSTDNVTFSDISGATGADYTSGSLTTTTYFRRAVTTDVGCGPSYTGSLKITVYNKLAGAVIGSDQNICFNTIPGTISQGASATGGDGTWTYQWESSSNGTSWSSVAGATATSYSPGVLTSTTYYRLMSIGGSGCGSVASNAVKILVYNDLYAGLVGNDQSVCPQSPASTMNGTTNPSGGDNSYTYQWQSSPDNTTWSDISGATSASFTSTTGLTSTTFYRRNVTSGSGCGTKPTNTVKITIAPLPKSSFIVANHCFNDVMPVTNNSTVATGSLTRFAWDFGNGNTSTVRVPAYVYATSGIKTVKLKVTSNIGCVDSSSSTVNVSNVPTPAFTKVFDCVKEEVLFKNATSVNCGKISAFAWDFGDGSTSTTQNPTHKYAATGTYSVKFKIFLPGGFIDSVTRSVTIAKKGVSGFTANDECFGDSVRFINASTNAASYTWDFDDKTSSTVENPVHFYRVAQSYDVTLIAKDGNECDDTTTKKVTVKVKPSVYFSKDDRCVNTGKPFNNGTLYAHSYAWTFGDGGTSNSAAKALTHIYTSAGTFDVKLVAYNNNGCRDSFETKVVSFPNPVAAFSLSNLCTGQAVSATNSSTSNHGNHWDMGDGATFTTKTPTYKYNKAGTYLVTLTVESDKGCKDTTRSNVTVYDTPKADFTATSVCAGGTTTFTNTSTGGSGTKTYAWNFGDGNTSSAKNPTHSYSAAGSYSVTLTTTGQGNCSGMVTKSIQVYKAPTVSVSVSDVCVGTASYFTSTTTGASTYDWDFGDGNSSTAQSPRHTYAKAGTYNVKLTAKSSYGCSTVETTTATVNDLPTAGFNNSTVCLGNATTFANTTSISSGTLSYAWNFGDGSTSTATNPSHTYSSSGNYTVTVTATANGCSNSYTTTVVVNDIPTADFTTANVCVGTAMSFSNYSGGATKYSWNFGDGSTASTATNPSHTYTSSGTFTVTLTAENAAGCTDTKSVSVTVFGTPTADFSASNACAGTAVSFTNNSSTGSYLWNFGDGGASTATTPSHTYKAAGTYTVMLTVKNSNGCESSTSSQITIHALPKTAFATASGCEKAGIQFTNNTAGTNTYAWTFGDGGTSAAKNPNHTYNSSGTFNVTLIATNGNGCSMEAKQAVVVSPQPTVAFTANSPCEGSAAAFSNTSTRGANSWTLGDGATSRLLNPSHTYASAGKYSVQLTVTTAAGCTNSMTSSVTVNPNPVASFSSKALCTGPNVDFTNTSSIGGGSIANSNWNYGDASTGTSNSHTYAKSGVYNVTLTVTSDRGCMTSTTSPVAVYEAPLAKFSTNDVCLGVSASFTNESSNASSSAWKFGDGNTSNVTNPTHTYGSASTYTVELTAMNPLGCSNVVTGSIKVSTNPTADFNAPAGCEGAATMFTNASTGANAYSWNFGDGSLSNQESPSHTFASSGNKNVTLMVRTNDGCSDEVTKMVVINTSPTAAFTAVGNCLGDETMFSNTSQNGTSFAWSFGDGNTSNNANPSNTYSATGDYRVLLIASNANCVDSTEQLVPVNPIPNSDFTHTTSGREVTFSPIELGGTSYSWNFADGNTSTSIAPVHRYSSAVVQTFNVCLTLTDKAGCTSEKCNDVNVDLVGVNDVTSENGVNVYPNPNKGAFVVTMAEINGDINIALYDTKGVLVTVVDTTKPSTQFNIDVTGVAEGVYFVQIKNGDYTSTQRVVITK